MAPKKTGQAKAKAAAKKEAAKQAFAAAAKRGAAPASSSAGPQSKKQKTAEQSPAQGPTKQETQGFLSFLKGAIAGKDQDRAAQAASVLAKYQELGLDPTKKREMIQEFFKAGGGKGKGLTCLHEQVAIYTEKSDALSWEGYINASELSELHKVVHVRPRGGLTKATMLHLRFLRPLFWVQLCKCLV